MNMALFMGIVFVENPAGEGSGCGAICNKVLRRLANAPLRNKVATATSLIYIILSTHHLTILHIEDIKYVLNFIFDCSENSDQHENEVHKGFMFNRSGYRCSYLKKF